MRRSLSFVALALGASAVAFFAAAGCSSRTSGSPGDAGGDRRGDATRTDAGADAVRDVTSQDAHVRADAGSVYLTELSVESATSADGSPPAALLPAFSPSVHDYYVRCAQGDNALTVSMTASAGAKSVLVEPVLSAALPMQTVHVNAKEGQLVEAAATDGTDLVPYWVRCLPHTFPQMQWQPHPEAGAPTPGYYLLGNNWTIAGENLAYAIVLDENGVPVWYYEEDGLGVYDVDHLTPGAISFVPNPSPTLAWEIHELSPPAVKSVGPPGPQLDDHELQLTKSGHYLLYTIPFETGFDLSGIGIPDPVTGKVGAHLGTNEAVASCEILEVDPASGKVVWTWDITSHFDPNLSCTYAQSGASSWRTPQGDPVYDVFHCNSIDLDPITGNLLVSARSMDSVFYVEYPSGKVLWKVGGTAASKDGAAFVPATDAFHRQHDARLRPGWSTSCGGHGQVSMFDDETAEHVSSRAVVYDVDVGGPGTACPPAAATIAWEHYGRVNSEYMGSFRVLADGSRTIGWGTGGVPGLIFTEVDVAHNDLLDLYFVPGGSSYRVIKVPLDALDRDAMRRSAGVKIGGF